MKKYTIEDVYKTCKEIGLTCISTEYEGIKRDLVFVCTKCGKQFKRNYDNLLSRRNTVCNFCGKSGGYKPTQFSFEYVKKYIEEESGSGCLLLSKKYSSTDEDLEIKCACGNIFVKTFYEFKNRGMTRCKRCTLKLIAIKNAIPKDELIRRVSVCGYTFLDSKLDGKDQQMLIQCDKHHDPYWVAVGKFKTGRRCPHCARSIGEEKIQDVLKNFNIEHIREFKIKGLTGIGGGLLRYDFALLDKNDIFCIIEYDGLQHFEVSFDSPESFEITKAHDKIKNEYVLSHKIKFIRIPYWDQDKIFDIVSKFIE